MRIDRLVALCVLVGLCACDRAPRRLAAADVASIKATYAEWTKAVMESDWKSAGDLLSEDYWSSWPNGAPVQGRDALITMLKTDSQGLTLAFEVDEVDGSGDLAFARARATETVGQPNGSSTTEHFGTLDILRRRADGKWQFTRGAGHVTDPLPSPPKSKAP